MVSFKYMSAAIAPGLEVGVVAIGPLINIAMFVAAALMGKLFYKVRHIVYDM
jgi:hypothetical protein